MTGWTDIITTAMTLIDDIRWREDLAVNPAMFYRAKSEYVTLALAMLNRPPELYLKLDTGKTAPAYADAAWTSTEESMTEQTAVQTGKTGFAICSVAQYNADGTKLNPYDAAYDPETGEVTFPIQAAAGINYTIDFYTDGAFPDLTTRQAELFAYAVAIVWDTRFERNFLNLQAKIHDSAFNVVNEANYADKISQRLMRNEQLFRDKLNKYEQDCAYAARFPRGGGTKLI